MRRAVIIGGSGMIGRAIARRLLASEWRVDVIGRNERRLPSDLARGAVGFLAADRNDEDAVRGAVGTGADLVVHCVCFTAAHARGLVTALPDVGSAVMISSKAVYVDAAGSHSNSQIPPAFTGPISESQPTLPPSLSDEYDGRLYGACKVAAENVLLESGYPVTVLRPSKVHGEGALKPNECALVKRVLDGRKVLPLAHRGQAADHPSAAVNIAALVETVGEIPGCRVLNAADPDSPNVSEIARVVSEHFGHHWAEVPVDADARIGRYPWGRWPPVRLDTSAARLLGYQPVGDYRATVGPTLDWLANIAVPTSAGARLPDEFENDYFDGMIDYTAEDSLLSHPEPG